VNPIFQQRQNACFDAMIAARGEHAVLVVSSAPVYIRNNDVEHAYRQDSDFFYLTGFDEPESVLVMVARERKMVLFVRPRDPERETWDGLRAGIEGAKSQYGAVEAFDIADFDKEIGKLLQNQHRLYYRLGKERSFDVRMLRAIDRARARGRSPAFFPTEIVEPATILHEMRLLKNEGDLAPMRRAAAITTEGHVRAMGAARPGMNEGEIEAILLETFRRGGAKRVAYECIVGSGPNATILHYRENNRVMQDGELLLIDAGSEYDFYASDVTRTFPVNGKFSREQQAIYELVLEAQLGSIAATRAGATVDDVHKVSVDIIARGLVKLGLLSGEPEKVIEEESYKAFYMHRTSHWLGMDVHDVGSYHVDGKPRRLAPGHVITVEPGIYIAKDFDKVPPEWRGIGVRIEDDILVTEGAPTNLTEAVPKTVPDVERACAR
jgi:Xaa-Pro aminopeptidase